MALNNNHTFEDLGESKCSVVEKNCSSERSEFIKRLLEQNGFKVVIVPTPAGKGPATQKNEASETAENASPAPSTFSVGVTDLSFNLMNALYNRELKHRDGKVVLPADWQQNTPDTSDEPWYWKNKLAVK